MNLQEFYATVNDSAFKGLTGEDVLRLLNSVTTADEDNRFVQIERKVFRIQKSVEIKDDKERGKVNGLSPQIIGEKIDDNGEMVYFFDPDVTKLVQSDFEYFERRFNKCSGVFPKTEYGLLVYFGSKTPYSKHNDFKRKLVDSLMRLSQSYWNKAMGASENNEFFRLYFKVLRNVLAICIQAKFQMQIYELFKQLEERLQNWDISRSDTVRNICDFSNVMTENYQAFKDKANWKSIVAKNLEAARYRASKSEEGARGALRIVEVCIEICKKEGADDKSLLRYKAELIEKIASFCTKALDRKNYIDLALRSYKSLDDKTKMADLGKKYSQVRGELELTPSYIELPQEYISQIDKDIQEYLSSAQDADMVICNIGSLSWFVSLQFIQEQAEAFSQEMPLLMICTNVRLDKFGNTNKTYSTEEELKEYVFWECFGFILRLNMSGLHQYVIESYKAGYLNYNSLIDYLGRTWYNEPVIYRIVQRCNEVRVIDGLRSVLKKLCEELDRSIQEPDYQFDYLIVVDSLTLKIETILRFILERLGIATFKLKEKAGERLVMEKVLDDMLYDLQNSPIKPLGYEEIDIYILKYAMTTKGYNLRNYVAHGLMDVSDYSFTHIVILLFLIIRMSTYQFTDISNQPTSYFL